MKKLTAFLLLFALFTCLLFGVQSPALAEPGGQYIRVRLSSGGARMVTLEITGTYRCNGTAFEGGAVTLACSNGSVRVVHEKLGLLSENAFIYLERRAGAPEEAFFTLENARYGRCRYLGDLYCCIDEDGALCLVNYVSMTQYLYGVTGGELRNSHPIEALKAQTIAAKGYALSCLGSDGVYDLTDRPADQVYKGYRPDHGNVIAAVDAVAGETLMLDGEPIKCYYCTSNGGQTLTPAMRWGAASGNNAAYEMRYDPYDIAGSGTAAVLKLAADAADWPAPLAGFLLQTACQQDDCVSAVLGLSSLTGFYDAENHTGSALSPCDRAPQAWAVALLRVRLQDGTETTLHCGFAPEVLLAAGVAVCEGADVWFVHVDDAEAGGWEIVFGCANGHRVGMSHCGMLEMARRGFSYDEILAFYYPGATLARGGNAVQLRAAAAAPVPTPYALQVVAQPEAAVDTDAANETPTVWDILLGWLP